MNYYFNTVLSKVSFDEAIKKVTAELKKEGFGVLTEIDIQKTFKAKLDIDFKKYRILGACNPQFAHKAIEAEDKIGAFLPCNIIVQQDVENAVEVSAVNPIAMMSSVDNKELAGLAIEIEAKLKRVIKNLN